jgi:probable rRNA maturation factor
VNLSLSRSDDAPLEWLDDGVVATLDRISRSLEPSDATVGVVVVDDHFIRDINARFRGKDRATDVISFSYLDDDSPAAEDNLVGEVYISHETVTADAAKRAVDVALLFLRVSVHGLLHVLGHDHETDEEADRMERRERDILSSHLGDQPADGLF